MQICIVCGISLNGMHHNKKICSKECNLSRYTHKCLFCGKEFKGKKHSKYCSHSCFAKHTALNPEWLEKTRKHRAKFFLMEKGKAHAKMHSERMKVSNPMFLSKIKQKVHDSKIKNGTLAFLGEKFKGKYTVPQLILASELGWEKEVVVKTLRIISDIPYCYKIDIGSSILKYGIEVDGAYHNCPAMKEKDAKKDKCLVLLGWKILRVTNKDILFSLEETLKKVRIFFNLGNPYDKGKIL